jgi:hypothetical protein
VRHPAITFANVDGNAMRLVEVVLEKQWTRE